MIIRREDFGNIKDLTKGSQKKIWTICDNCGIGILKTWKNYLKRKSNYDLCKSCSLKTDIYRINQSKKSKERWQDDEYKEKMSFIYKNSWNDQRKKKIGFISKERWQDDEYKENHIKKLKRKWQDDEYKENHIKKLKRKWQDDEYKEKMSFIYKNSWNDQRKNYYSQIMIKRWQNDEYKENHIKKVKNSLKLSYKYIKEQIEKEGYELLSDEYINANNKLRIKCSKNHEFLMRYGDFQQGIRCPSCPSIKSISEKEISEYLKSLNVNVIENDRSIIHPLELDIVIPEKKIAIEYCGLYWHSEKYKDKNYHLNKLEKCNEAEYHLITIFEDEWIHKQDIVKNRLKYILGLSTERIYARKCIIKEINTKQAREFIDKYHIQGYSNASLCLGAFYENQLVAVNTFIKRNNEYELNRFCSSTNVIGIASKLLKYFQRNYEYEKIITFADRRWSEGNLYETIGFIKDKELDPDYSYTKNFLIRFHKFNFRHKQMKNKLENYNPQLTEKKNMLNNGWLRIYDCGKIRYIMI